MEISGCGAKVIIRAHPKANVPRSLSAEGTKDNVRKAKAPKLALDFLCNIFWIFGISFR